MRSLLILFSLVTLNAYACPEMNDIDLSSSMGEEKYEVLERASIMLEEDEFNKIPNLSEFDYEECRDHLTGRMLQSTITGKKYLAITTNDDSCDGGNSYGALLDEKFENVVADINDGGIYCY